MPHIALLSPLWSNPTGEHGGITPVIRNLAQGLMAQEAEVTLLVCLPAGHPAPSTLDPARVVDLGPYRRRQTRRALMTYLQRQSPDALLSAGHRFNRLALAVPPKLRHKTRVILSVHNTMSTEIAQRGWWKRWERRRQVRQYRQANGVIAVSLGVADDLVNAMGLDAKAIRVIHNPILTTDTQHQAQQPCPHPWLNGPARQPVILAAGRLCPQKGFDVLIESFAKLIRQRPARLIILGEGAERERLQSQIERAGLGDQVDLPGFVDNPSAYMAQASLFVLPSRFEGFGNVLVEAMAAGAPVVATDCPSGPAEILANGVYGPLVPPQDPAALAQAMHQQLLAPTPKARLQQGAERFAVAQAAHAYLTVLCPGSPHDH